MELTDGRICQLMPWTAEAPCPWRPGYSRVFIEFTDAEKRNATHRPHLGRTKNGHIQIVKNNKLVKTKSGKRFVNA